MDMRSRDEVWDRLQIEKAKLIKAKVGLDGNEILKHETIINTLEWLHRVEKE
jgi:hypothetical protein